MFKLNLKKILLFFVLIVNLARFSFAEDISVRAEVNANKIALGTAAQLTITIMGVQNASPVDLPSLDGFDVRYLGPSRRVQIVNNSYSSSLAFTYSLFATKSGKFEIPSLKITVDGQDFNTEAIPIEVVESTTSMPNNSGGKEISLQDKIFLVLKTSKKDIFPNEKIPVKVLFYYSSEISVSDVQYPKIENPGFLLTDFSDYHQSQDIVNGVRFNVIEFDTNMYPTREGQLAFGPARIDCNILIPNQRRRSSLGGFDSFFDDDFFGGFLGNYEKRPISVKSSALQLNIIPLPGEGKPYNFSGAVGEFNFDVKVSPVNVKVGDPITLKMSVSGSGNLEAVKFPEIKANDDFKLYDPNIKEEKGTKLYEQVLIPKNPNIKYVPSLDFSYFDVGLKKYRSIKKGPFSLTVQKLKEGEDLKVVGLDDEKLIIEPEKLGKDIVFIKDDPGKFYFIGKRFYNSKSYYLLLFIFFAAWTSLYLTNKWNNRIQTDIVFARKLQAPRAARKGLMAANKMLKQGKKEEFYDEIFKTLQQYLGHKFHLSSGAITFSTIVKCFEEKPLDHSIIDDIKVIFEQCDMVRYAAANISGANMEESYLKTERLIDYLERDLK